MSQYSRLWDFHEIDIRSDRTNEHRLWKTILRTLYKYEGGYLTECDLENPSNIHETKKIYFLPEKKNNYCTRFCTLYDG